MTIKQLEEKVSTMTDSVGSLSEKSERLESTLQKVAEGQVENTAIMSKGINAINEIKKVLMSDQYGNVGAVARGIDNTEKILLLEKSLTSLKTKVHYTIILVGIIASLFPFLKEDFIFELISKLF